MTSKGPRNPVLAFPFQTSGHERGQIGVETKHGGAPAPDGDTAVLTVPGLGGSGPAHWQSRWETERKDCRRVQLPSWNIPHRDEWIAALDQAVRASAIPPVIAAHSLGCILVAHWAAENPDVPVGGALMVAPADVDDTDTIPAEAQVFAPLPLNLLPFPTTVLASSNDTYITLQRAQVLATAWGADFHNLGALGHINADSHLENWDAGWDYIDNLRERQLRTNRRSD